MIKTKVVSLGAELDQLRNTIEGVRLLVQALEHDSFETVADERLAAVAANAALALVSTRLRDVVRAIRGSLDPGVLATPQNETMAKTGHRDDPDVLLFGLE